MTETTTENIEQLDFDIEKSCEHTTRKGPLLVECQRVAEWAVTYTPGATCHYEEKPRTKLICGAHLHKWINPGQHPWVCATCMDPSPGPTILSIEPIRRKT